MKGIFTKALIAVLCIGQASSFAMEQYFDADVLNQVKSSLAGWNTQPKGISVPVMEFIPQTMNEAQVIASQAVETAQEAITQVAVPALSKAEYYWNIAKGHVFNAPTIAKGFASKVGGYVSGKLSDTYTYAQPAMKKAFSRMDTARETIATQFNKAVTAATPYVEKYANAVKPYTLDVVKEHPYITAGTGLGLAACATAYYFRKPIANIFAKGAQNVKGWFTRAETNEHIVKFVEDLELKDKQGLTPQTLVLVKAFVHDMRVINGEKQTNENTSRFYLTACSNEKIQILQGHMRDLFNAKRTGIYINHTDDNYRTKELIYVKDARFEAITMDILAKTYTALCELE